MKTKKTICICFFAGLIFSVLSANSKAQFVDMGFSSDGKYYVFGQYNSNHAEFCAVDLEKNVFVPGSNYEKDTLPSAEENNCQLFDELLTEQNKVLADYDLMSDNASTLLYIASDSDTRRTIQFRDFENVDGGYPLTYSIRLTELVEGEGQYALSSFYLWVEMKNRDGTVLKRMLAGNPQIKRRGVTGYRINRVLSDGTGKNLIFVIEKKTEKSNKEEVQYMVETLSLS